MPATFWQGVKAGSSSHATRSVVTFVCPILTIFHFACLIFPELPDIEANPITFLMGLGISFLCAAIGLIIDGKVNARKLDEGDSPDPHFGPAATDMNTFSFLMGFWSYLGQVLLSIDLAHRNKILFGGSFIMAIISTAILHLTEHIKEKYSSRSEYTEIKDASAPPQYGVVEQA